MNNRIIGIFESGNSLADKLDCYYFYNELRKYYNEGEQLDNNLWQVIFYFKNRFSYVNINCFIDYLNNFAKLPNIEEYSKLSMMVLNEYYHKFNFYHQIKKLNTTLLNKINLVNLYIKIYEDIAKALNVLDIENQENILNIVDSILTNSVTLSEEIVDINYSRLELGLRFLIRDSLLKSNLELDKFNYLDLDKKDSYLLKHVLASRIAGVSREETNISEVCKKLDLTTINYAKRRISLAIKTKRN